MSDEELLTSMDIQRLELRPGDILVVRFQRYLPAALIGKIKDQLKSVLPPEQKCIILEGGADICVITREQVAQL